MKAKPLTQVELHNQLAPEIVASIVRPVLVAGGDLTDVMVLTESVLVGVAQALARLGLGMDPIEAIAREATRRRDELRLLDARKEPNQ